jgi:ubiquinone/menaquinone biosynthesis C-methylase UbiE
MSVRDFYGRFAGLYDAIATFPGVGRWRHAAAEALALSPGDTVVEMGCGSGANLPYLRERVGSDGRVVGIDLTRPLLERARGRGDAGLAEADATRPPVHEADAVLASFVCGMLDDPGAAVDRWCDLAGPGGRVALLDATPTTGLVGRPLNPAFRAFTRGTAPAESVVDAGRAALMGAHDSTLEQRVDASRRALVARTEHRGFERFGLGFVDLLSGRVR